MHRPFAVLLFVLPTLLTLLLMGGCSREPIPEEGGNAKTTAAPGKTKSGEASAEKKQRPAPVARTSWEGNWVLEFSQLNPQDGFVGFIPMALIRISRSKSGEWEPRLVQTSRFFPRLQIESARVSPETVSLVCAGNRGQFRFQASYEVQRKGATAEGNLALGGRIIPARFYPTGESTLQKFLQLQKHPHHDEFQQAARKFHEEHDPQPLQQFIQQHPDSPLAYYAIFILDPLTAFRKNLSDNGKKFPVIPGEEVRAHLQRLDTVMPHWGPRLHLASRLHFATNLSTYRVAPQLVLHILRELEAGRPKWPLNTQQKQEIALLKESAETEVACQQVLQKNEEKTQKAAEDKLRRFVERGYRYHPYVLYVLAESARKAGRTREALRRFAELAVLPQLANDLAADLRFRGKDTTDFPQQLRQRVESLWKEKEGDLRGLPAYLDEVYSKAVYAFLKDAPPLRPLQRAGRTVLCELVTSTECPDCVALDVAVGALGRTFSPKRVIVLRYHLAVPQPGPLATLDAQQKSRDYGVRRPPEILINGKAPRRQFPGTLATVPLLYWRGDARLLQRHQFSAPVIYGMLRRSVEGEMARPAEDCTLELSTTLKNQQLQITARIGRMKQPTADWRLRFALAEDHISYTGSNGIRRHEMVVRHLPEGVEGLPLKPEKDVYQTAVDLQRVRQRLLDYLVAFEEGGRAKFSIKPVDFRNLHLVGWLQNRKTGEVRCARSLPVMGTATYYPVLVGVGPVAAPRPRLQSRPAQSAAPQKSEGPAPGKSAPPKKKTRSAKSPKKQADDVLRPPPPPLPMFRKNR